MSEDVDPREELRSLVSAARAWVEWQAECGSESLPSVGDPAELLAGLDRRPVGARPRVPAAARAPVAPSTSATAAAPVRVAPAAVGSERSVPRVPSAPATPSRLSSEERRTRLATVAETVKVCTRCSLHATRKQTVFSRGNPEAELCFIGEGPGADEDAQGAPFVGKAGQLLDKMIAAMGLRQDEVYIANVVKCRPPDNRTPEPAEMASCLPYLNEQLDSVRPRVIVALGGTAVRGLLGPTAGITKIRGTWRLYRGATPLMPTFHPAYVLRQPTKEVRGMVWSDLQQVLNELGRPLPGRGT